MKQVNHNLNFETMKKLFIALLLYFAGFSLMAQTAPEIEWQKTYGGTEGDVANWIVATPDGGYAVAGYTNSKGAGNSDFWIMKLDANGNQVWEKTFGGKRYDVAKTIITTADGGYLVVGETKSQGEGSLDIWTLKLTEAGELQWEQTYGGKGAEFCASYGAVVASIDGYVITGHTASKGTGGYDCWVFKIDHQGKKLWDKTFGGKFDDFTSKIITTSDGGYVIAANISPEQDLFDFWMLKLNANGEKDWDKAYNQYDVANAVVVSPDGGYVVTGNSYEGEGNSNMWVLRLDNSGGILWEKTFGGRQFNYANQVVTSLDGNAIIAGFTNSEGTGNYDFWVVNLNKIGNIEWTKTFGGKDDDRAKSIITTNDGSFVVAGYTKSTGAGLDDLHIIKFDGYLFDLNDCLQGKLDTLKYLANPKNEFESTKEYNKRLKLYESFKADITEKCAADYKVMSNQKILESTQLFKAKIAKLSYYNADAEAYKILLDKWYVLKMPIEQAQQFKENYQYGEVQGVKRLSANLRDVEYINMILVDSAGKEHKFGTWIKSGKDANLKIFNSTLGKNDSIPVVYQEVSFPETPSECAGTGFKSCDKSEDYLWAQEVAKFEQEGGVLGTCLKVKMVEHKDLIRTKGEFETTKEFKARVKEYNMYKKDAYEGCGVELKSSNTERLKQSYEIVNFNIEKLGEYNADKEEIEVYLQGARYTVSMPVEEAKSFKEHWKNMEVKGVKRLDASGQSYENINMKIYHSAAGKKYPIGKQVRPQDDPALQEFYNNSGAE